MPLLLIEPPLVRPLFTAAAMTRLATPERAAVLTIVPGCPGESGCDRPTRASTIVPVSA